MDKITIVKIEACIESLYIQPKSLHYVQNGREKRWDMVDAHNSVAILLYHKEFDAFVFVKQFRPAIYLKNNDGFTYELCAGLVDKEKPLAQIALEEIEEETGYGVAPQNLHKITSFYTAVGLAGGQQTLYYAELDESMRLHQGGGIEMEEIEVIYVPRQKAKAFLFDERLAKTSGLMFALMWFFERDSRV